MFDHYGDVSSRGGSPEGIFHKDTRFLSDLRVLVNGQRPLLLSSTVQDNNALLAVDLTNPDLVKAGNLELARDTLQIARSKFLFEGACYERLGVHNFGWDAHAFEFVFYFSADFADIFELRGHRRERRGTIETTPGENGVVFLYHGLDGVVRRTTIGFDPRPAEIGKDSARFLVELNPGERASLFMTVACEERTHEQSPVRQFFVGLRDARRALVASTARAASVETSNDIFNEVLCRAVADLYMLMTDTPQGAIPYAGIPWFSTPFGRDAIITAIEMMWLDSTVAKGVLRFLAATQAKDIRRESEAEPGKILHEMRSGEMARLGEVPFAFYYGSVDSTPLFVMLAGLYYERTRDLATISELWPNIEAALHWIDDYGDRDGDGFVEYQGGETGLTNQGWKDSAIPFSTPTEATRHIRSRSARCKVMSSPQSGSRRSWPPPSALPNAPTNLNARRKISGFDSRRRSGAMISAPTRSRSTGASALAECGRQTPVTCCSPASSRRNERRRWRSSFGPDLLHRLGDQDDRFL